MEDQTPAPAIRIWHQGFLELEASPGYREALQQHVGAVARPGTQVEVHGMPPGSFAGTTPAEVARHLVLSSAWTWDVVRSVVAGEQAGADAAVIGILQDLGLREAQTLVEIPVVGYGEVSMHLACQLGRRFAVLAFNPDLFPLLEDRIGEYGLAERVSGLHQIGLDYAAVAGGFGDPAPVVAAFRDAAQRAVRAGADVLIPGQMVLSEILWAMGVREVEGAPVIDGMGACIVQAEALVQLRRVSGLGRSRRGHGWSRPPAELARRVLGGLRPAGPDEVEAGATEPA